ncbi:expressed unknown protein [Seminavis robusta]|uniref:Uncharacterized protein n=1 Tax=Seminavis robusta TaxID=568900 RepID=A0A9N8H857_9STRA|nr:expressed unknown protein [Seminavis robusta]|eukprot:Sro149_g068690.1 n/a (1341) ;mRNA; r:93003-97193
MSLKEEEYGCDRLGKLLFLQLDPTIRQLLALLQRQQEIADKNNDMLDNKEEEILGLLRQEATLLETIQRRVVDFPQTLAAIGMSSLSSSSDPSSLFVESLAILMDYITLPIVAILRRQQQYSSVVDPKSVVETTRRLLQIRQSAQRKSSTVAARTLQLCLERMEQGSVSLSPIKLKNLLLACASALPTGRELSEQSSATMGLDTGDFYLESVLTTIEYLLRLGAPEGILQPNGNGEKISKDKEMASAMDGALLAHLADVCIAIVAPPSTFPFTTMKQALRTLEQLMEASPSPLAWRSLFPGLFAGLFRTMVSGLTLQTQTAQTKPVVIVSSLKACTRLLRLTLADNALPEQKTSTVNTLSDLKKSIAQKQQQQSGNNNTRKILGDNSNSNKNGQSTTTTLHKDDPNETFLEAVNNRLPGPLTVLANLLLTAPKEEVRREASDLYRVLLLEARACWDKEIQTNLSMLSLESSLILSRDDDRGVANAAQSVLNDYQRNKQFKLDMNSFLAPKTVAMLEELAALAQRQSEVELRKKLKLITALVSLNNNNSSKTSSSKSKILRSSLATEGVFLNLQQALSTLLDLDFESLGEQRSSFAIITLVDGELDRQAVGPRAPRRKFLTPASERETMAMLQELGKLFGPKQTAILVDSMVANLFNDCLARMEAGTSRSGHSQVTWCHAWVGCMTIIQQLLRGGFATVDPSSSSKKKDKRAKYLGPLATSILPIIVSSPLWDLTLTEPELKDSPQQDQPLIDRPGALALTDDSFSAGALRGNACLIHGLIGIVQTVTELLRVEASSLLAMVLPPLFEKATIARAEYVRAGARAALESVAISVGYTTMAGMINENMSVVASSILAKLRLPGGVSSFPAGKMNSDIFDTAHTIQMMLELAIRGSGATGEREDRDILYIDRQNISYVIELVMTLTERYDCLGSKGSHESDKSLTIVHAYESAFRFANHAYRTKESAARRSLEKSHASDPNPWLEQLEPFRALHSVPIEVNDGLEGDVLSPKDGFEAYRNSNDREEQGTEQKEHPKDNHDIVSNHEIRFVSMLVSRCTFFLSNYSLKLQIDSCTAMAEGFRFLAIVALICKDPENKTGTAILRQVNDAWPAIHARLVALTSEIRASRARSIVIAQRHSAIPTFYATEDVSTKRVFLSKLFDLIAIMAECSKEFIASRMQNDVFPLLGELLGDFVTNSSDLRESRRDGQAFSGHIHPRQPSETLLIVAMLTCFSKLFDRGVCGRSLAGFVPSVGTMILPFLGDAHVETSKACETTIRQMVRIDCDALWRPLVQLSGGIVAVPKPGESHPTSNTSVVANASSQTSLQHRAAELVMFINSLPEQPLD